MQSNNRIMLPSHFTKCLLVIFALYLVRDVCSQECERSLDLECGRSPCIESTDGKFVNATEGSWTWMAFIMKETPDGEKTLWCNGFLIDSLHVLTEMSHFHDLVYDKEDTYYSAMIGSVDMDEAEEYPIDSIILQEGPVENQFLVIMKLTVRVFHRFYPICLPDEWMSRIPLEGLKATVALRLQFTPKVLVQLNGIEIMSDADCHKDMVIGHLAIEKVPESLMNISLCGRLPKGYEDYGVRMGIPLMVQIKDRWFAFGMRTYLIDSGSRAPVFIKMTSYLGWIKNETVSSTKKILAQKP